MDAILNKFYATLSSLSGSTDIGDRTLAALPESIVLTDPDCKQFSGVTLDLPQGTTVSIMMEAVRIGRTPLLAASMSVKAMAESGPGPTRRRLMEEALDHLHDFGAVLLGCRASTRDNLLHRLQEEITGAIRHIYEQRPDLLPTPLDHYGMELWAEPGAIYFMDEQNKHRNERVIPLVDGTALVDIAASLKESPLALAVLALLEMQKHCGWSHDLNELIEETTTRMAADMANHALKRLTPEKAFAV